MRTLSLIFFALALLTSKARGNHEWPCAIPVCAAGRPPTGIKLSEIDGAVPHERYTDLPVFGDIHGNIEGLLNTVRDLQRLNRVKYPFVLQVGDLGYYPNWGEFPKTNSARPSSPLETGVNRFLTDPKLHRKYFVSAQGCNRLECKILFVRGNHDDPNALKALSDNAPIGVDAIQADPYGVLHYLRDGGTVKIQVRKNQPGGFVLGGYGGIDPASRPKAYLTEPGISFNPKIVEELLISPGEVDVLLTHQGSTFLRDGSPEIDALIELSEPRLHLHGHSHLHMGPMRVGNTTSFSIGKMPMDEMPTRKNGFMGMLRYHRDGRIEFVPTGTLMAPN